MLKICVSFRLASGARKMNNGELRKYRSAYMNRYTDWPRLPSEDEAIKICQETYDKSFEEQRTNRQ